MQITIFTKPGCPYCARAKAVFSLKGLNFSEITNDTSGRREVRKRLSLAEDATFTWPQVFVGDTHIGGSDDLAAWDKDGRLDALLS